MRDGNTARDGAIHRPGLQEALVEPERVSLREEGNALRVTIAGGPHAAEGPIVLEPPAGVDATLWAASRINRMTHAVRRPDPSRFAHWEEASVESEIRAGTAACSRLEGAVLMFKAGTLATPEAARAVAERLDEVGYAATRVRLVDPAEIRESGLIRRHYASHWQIAEAYSPTPEERVRLLDIYEGATFEAEVGHPAASLEVVPAFAFAEREGIDPARVAAWSATAADVHGLNSGHLDGPNELGDLTCAHLLRDVDFHAGPPVFLLNPHMLTVAGWYERAESPLLAALIVAETEDALPWGRVREEVLGTSDPTIAMPGSIRRDVRQGILPLRYHPGVAVDHLHNGVHLSNGPIEAAREAAIWFGVAPGDWPLGRALIACSGWSEEELLGVARVEEGGRPGILVDRTSGMSPEEAIDFLLTAAPADSRRDTSAATTLRVDLCWRLARQIAGEDPGVIAVIATGSVAQSRCSDDSDVDIIAIHDVYDAEESDDRIDRAVVDGVMVEMEHISRAAALERASAPGGDMRSLKRASRLGMALAVLDPEGLVPKFAELSRALEPDSDDLKRRVITGLAALHRARERYEADGSFDRDALQSCCDSIAYLLLITSPLRYQKPKWVLDDLRRLGEEEARTAIVQCYGVSSDAVEVRASLDRARAVLDAVAAAEGMPSFEEARERGLIPEFPVYSYTCQCLTDAESLLDDGLIEDADFAGRFTARMGMGMLREATQATPKGRAALAAYDALFEGLGAEGEVPPFDTLHALLMPQ